MPACSGLYWIIMDYYIARTINHFVQTYEYIRPEELVYNPDELVYNPDYLVYRPDELVHVYHWDEIL